MAKSFIATNNLMPQKTRDKSSKVHVGRKSCVIIIVGSFDQFMGIYYQLASSVFKFNGFYLIVFVNGEVLKIEEVFKLFWQLQTFNVNCFKISEDEHCRENIKSIQVHVESDKKLFPT